MEEEEELRGRGMVDVEEVEGKDGGRGVRKEDGRRGDGRLWSRELLDWCSLGLSVRLSGFLSFFFWILLSSYM